MTVPRGWGGALLAMLLLQGVAAFLLQLLPTLAPLFAEARGWPPGMVGYLSAGGMLALMLFLLIGTPVLDWLGPVRAMQAGMVVALAGLLLVLVPHVLAVVAASALIGLAYGPTMPGGSVVLQRQAPTQQQSLVFSIKQTGVPLGGALAGVALPAAAGAVGWEGAVALAAALAVLAILAVQPMRAGIDAERIGRPALARLRPSLATLRGPFAVLTGQPALLRVAVAGAALALNQSCWNAFLVVYLVSHQGLDLATAGGLFTIMQMAVIAGRLLLGWLADRAGSPVTVMGVCALCSAGASAVLAAITPAWPLWLVALAVLVGGICVAGWNGILLAELARRSPAGRIAETASAGMLLVCLGLVLGPATVGTFLSLGGGFSAGFLLCTVPLLLSCLWLLGHSPQPDRAMAERE